MSNTLPSSKITPAIPAVVIVVDSSYTLYQEWQHILVAYCTPLFARLAEGHSMPQFRLGFVTYGPPDCGRNPLFVNRFFAVGVHNELRDKNRLEIGCTNTGGSLGMAALDGYAAAIEMFDLLKSGVNQKPLRPLSLNEARDRPKEVFSYHLWHFAAGQPDDAKYPRWNRSPALDSLTWKTVPAELKKREINCSMLLVSPSPKFSKVFSEISDARLAPWFPTRPSHTILLSGFAPSPKPRAAVPSTIPAKRSADSPAEQRSPGPKISKPSSQTASPALTAARKPLLQSSPLIPSAIASSAPPSSSSATSPTVPPATAPNSSPPKPPPREPSDGAIIDLTQSTIEIVPPTVQPGRGPPPQPNPLQQALPTQPQSSQLSQPLSTPQSQGPSSMQPQPQPSSFALNLKPPASADPMEMLNKLKQVETRIADLRSKQAEAAQAGRTEEANKLQIVLNQHVAAYRKGREFMMKMLEAKRAAAAAQGQGQGQGPSQPPHDPAPTAGTTQHSTPTMSARHTPQPTPNANSRSTPRLAATPLMAANPNPMSSMNPSPSHASTNSSVGVGSGSAANANAALLQAFNPAATQIPTQSGLAGPSGPDAHSLATMSQHGLPHNNSNLGQQQQMPANLAAQMRKLVEQRGLTQNGQTLLPAGNSTGTNGGTGAPAAPAMAGGFSEARDAQWVGTFVWQGTDPARNEKKEVRAQIVAIAPSGNPMASTWPKVLSLSPAGPAVQMNELQEWMKRTQPVLMRVQPAPGTDDHGFGQLVKLLRERSFYAVTGWEIPGTGRTTTNLLIAPFSQGLLGAAFPTSGMPEMPKPRVPQQVDPTTVRLDPAVRQAFFNLLPQQLRNFPEPQLTHIITQLFLRQQQRSQTAAALSQQQQQQQHQQAQQQQQQQQQQAQQTQQQPDRFPQNPGVNMASNGSMFGNLALKQGELNPFVPGSQANAIASGLMIQPTTSLEQLQQRQQQQQQQQAQQQQAQQQQAQQQQQQQQQQAQQNQHRAILEMQRALSGGLGAGVGAGLGGGLMNTGVGGGGLGMPGGLGSHGPGFGNGGNGMAGAGIGLGLSGASFGALGGGTGMDGAGGGGASGGAGESNGGLNGMGANAVTMDMFQSFLHRNGEGVQGQ